jgi:hypothetical protein
MRSTVPPARQGQGRHIASGPAHGGGMALQRLGTAATTSPAVARLASLQRTADAAPVLQRNEEDREALRLYLTEIGGPLDLTEEDVEEIAEIAVTAGDLEEGKAWLEDWVDAMISGPAILERGMDKIGVRYDLEDEMTARGIPEDLLPADQQAELVERLLDTETDKRPGVLDRALQEPMMRLQIRQDLAAENIPEDMVIPDELAALLSALATRQAAERQLANPGISKTQKPKQMSIRNQADTKYKTTLKSIATRLAKEAEQRQKEQAARDFSDDFDHDKEILVDWVTDNTGGQVQAILLAVLAAHTIGSGFDATVTKKYRASDIMDAHDTWWELYKGTKDRMRVVGAFQNPGNRDDGIKWKDRGPQWECTRNFIAYIGKHMSNVHVTPNGGDPKPKARFSTQPAPLR